MQIRLLKKIVSDVAGTEAEKIVDLLYDKKNVNEFLIAKNLSMTINQTRNLLYKLVDEGLISFTRKKDKRKGGWYTYFWTLDTGKGVSKFYDKIQKNIEALKMRIAERKNKSFYVCSVCGREYSEEQALLHEYTCPECGEVVQLKDSSQEIINLEKEV